MTAKVSTIDHVFKPSAASLNSMNVDYAANKPLEGDQGFLEFSKYLTTQFSLSRLPSPEPSIFSGYPLSYPSLKGSFKAVVYSYSMCFLWPKNRSGLGNRWCGRSNQLDVERT